ncbi:hypothetical protein PGT21_017328 [Puccinia graminis f. sp. tritici]|nr:hypothetical protein PGT21_017328 [Puccinia graminis f. sp. tritici]
MLKIQMDLYNKNKDAAAGGVDFDECSGTLFASMGIHCWHMLADILEERGVVETVNIHDQWKLYYDPDNLLGQNAEPPYNFHDDYAALKEEILAKEKESDLPGLMAKLRQVRSNTHVVPLGHAPIVRNTRKVPKKKRKQGYTRSADRDPIHAEVAEAQVNQAQAQKRAASNRGKRSITKGKAKARKSPASDETTTSDESAVEPDPVTRKQKQPTRSTRAAKMFKQSVQSDSGEGSSSASESEDDSSSAGCTGGSDADDQPNASCEPLEKEDAQANVVFGADHQATASRSGSDTGGCATGSNLQQPHSGQAMETADVELPSDLVQMIPQVCAFPPADKQPPPAIPKRQSERPVVIRERQERRPKY